MSNIGLIKQLQSLVLPLSGKVRLLASTTDNIHFNLATEQYLFEKAQLIAPVLFLWRNNTNIVIGKHQNPWKQCRVEQMKKDNILLARRKTGGGAVYHDLGNTCFSFFNPDYSNGKVNYKSINNAILLKTFQRFGIPAQVTGRNDIEVKGKKISGSAYRLHLGGKGGKGRKTLHHGTVLFSVNTNSLVKYLNPNEKKLKSKGVDSVRSRIMNLTEEYPQCNHQIFCRYLSKDFGDFYQQKPETEILDYDILNKNPEIAKNYERLTSWDWLYGQTPDFEHSIEKKFDWGLIEVQFNVHEGSISEVKVYSDCLIPEFISILNEEIRGIKYSEKGIREFQNRMGKRELAQVGSYQDMVRDLKGWFVEQI